MDMNHLDNDFVIAAELFITYKEALSQNNNDSLIEQTKSKIVIQFYQIIQKSKSMSEELKEYSDIIVQKVVTCLKTYSDKNPDEFCKLTYSSIRKALKGKADTESFESKTGMHIPDPENRKRKRIEKAYKQFITFQSTDKESFIEYAISYLGFERQDLEEYLFPKHTVSLFAQSKIDSADEYCVADNYIDSTRLVDNGEVIASTELLQAQLKAIDILWINQKKNAQPLLSELLTRELLSDIKNNTASDNMIEIFKQSKFICKEMVEAFFADKNYKLPSQQQIGQKYGITKSAASVKMTRFFEKLKENVNF